MKKWFCYCLCSLLMITLLSGCGGQDKDQTVQPVSGEKEGTVSEQDDASTEGEQEKEQSREGTQSSPTGQEAQEEANTSTTDTNDSISLEQIRKAAKDSGFTVTEGHNLVFMSEVKEGICVEITADEQTTIYSFIECQSEEAAIKNAEDIDNAGYNLAIRNGRFLTCYGVDKKNGIIKDILATLLSGQKIELQPEAPASAEVAETTAEQTIAENSPATKPTDATGSEQVADSSITGTWSSGAISGYYDKTEGKYKEAGGMGVMYTFLDDGTFSQIIVFGNHTVTTGKYSVKDGLLTLTKRVTVESTDNGESWSEQEPLPDASAYYELGKDDTGAYLLLGQEGASLPLEASVNAMKLSLKE